MLQMIVDPSPLNILSWKHHCVSDQNTVQVVLGLFQFIEQLFKVMMALKKMDVQPILETPDIAASR